VLRRYGLERPARIAVTLVSPLPVHRYTGMLTGYVAGEYELRELTFPLDELCRWAGVEFICAAVTRIDAASRRVSLSDGRGLTYDALSLNVGSTVAGLDLPGVAPVALPVKPLESIVALPEALKGASGVNPRLLVVGGGAAGVELALTASARLRREGRTGEIVVVERERCLLPTLDARAGAAASRILARASISVALGSCVVSVDDREARGARREVYPFDVVIWAAGPRAPSLFADSALATDASGYLRVDGSLAAVGSEGVFGAGDCVSLEGAPWVAKAGVYAVRQAPVLWQALRSYLLGGPPPAYRPQRHFLYALNTGDGRALLGRNRFLSHSRWARWLKDAIDRKFMRRYLRLVQGGS
jgi:NADH dehydrogenase FAD-containing subunit